MLPSLSSPATSSSNANNLPQHAESGPDLSAFGGNSFVSYLTAFQQYMASTLGANAALSQHLLLPPPPPPPPPAPQANNKQQAFASPTLKSEASKAIKPEPVSQTPNTPQVKKQLKLKPFESPSAPPQISQQQEAYNTTSPLDLSMKNISNLSKPAANSLKANSSNSSSNNNALSLMNVAAVTSAASLQDENNVYAQYKTSRHSSMDSNLSVNHGNHGEHDAKKIKQMSARLGYFFWFIFKSPESNLDCWVRGAPKNILSKSRMQNLI